MKMKTKRYLPRLELALLCKLLLLAKSTNVDSQINPQELLANVYVPDVVSTVIGFDDKGLIKIKTISFSSAYLNEPSIHWITDEQIKKIKSGKAFPYGKTMASIDLISQFTVAWEFSHKEHHELPPLWFTANIHIDKIQQKLSAYINSFMAGGLVPTDDSTPYSYAVQRKRAIQTIKDISLVSGTANIVVRDYNLWGEDTLVEMTQRKTTFLETMLGLEQDGYLTITDVIDTETIRISLTKEAVQSIPRVFEWESISLDNNGFAVINGIKHRYDINGEHYKLLERLLEQRLHYGVNPEVKRAELCQLIGVPLDKNGWEVVKQKVRDMRRYHKINRKDNPEDDVFKDTSRGYMLITPRKDTRLKQQ